MDRPVVIVTIVTAQYNERVLISSTIDIDSSASRICNIPFISIASKFYARFSVFLLRRFSHRKRFVSSTNFRDFNSELLFCRDFRVVACHANVTYVLHRNYKNYTLRTRGCTSQNLRRTPQNSARFE